MSQWSIDPAGPDALIIRFGTEINPALVPLIRAAKERLADDLQRRTTQVRDLIPSYTTLTVCYDPTQNDFQSLSQKIRERLNGLSCESADAGRTVEIPVWYDLEVGPDLERVAQQHRISIKEVVHRHTQRDYWVFAIGFAPGFAYLGNVDTAIATPRLTTPRTRVPAGSVAIADRQTAIYPITTPGGWNILGRTAVKMFDPELEALCPLAVGDRVRFVAITREQFVEDGGTIEWPQER